MDKFENDEHDSLPNFDKLILCSNVLIQVDKFFYSEKDAYEPLVIKKSEDGTPRIWIYALNAEQNLITIVADSAPRLKSIQSYATPTGCKVTHDGVTLLEAVLNEEDILEIIKLDFRPVGLNIFGDTKSLHLGGMTTSRNVMKKTKVFVGI